MRKSLKWSNSHSCELYSIKREKKPHYKERECVTKSNYIILSIELNLKIN